MTSRLGAGSAQLLLRFVNNATIRTTTWTRTTAAPIHSIILHPLQSPAPRAQPATRCLTTFTLSSHHRSILLHHHHHHQQFHPFSSSHVKKPPGIAAELSVQDLQLKTAEVKALAQDAIEKRREALRERRDDFVADMRAKRQRVRQRVRTKMDEIGIVERENVLTIPNLLTVSRAALAPYMYHVVSVQGDYAYAMGLLAFAGLTDLLDGQIARNWPSQASKMGSFLDPMADKLLVGALAMSMWGAGLFPGWLCGMVLFRDVFLVAAGFVIRYISLPPPVSCEWALRCGVTRICDRFVVRGRKRWRATLTSRTRRRSWSRPSSAK